MWEKKIKHLVEKKQDGLKMTTDDSTSDVHSQWRSSIWWNALKLMSPSLHLFSDSIKLQFSVHLSLLKDVLMIESADWMIGIVFNITCSTTDWLSWYVTIAHTRSCLTVSGLLKSSFILFPSLLSLSRDAAFMWDSVTCGNVSDLPSPSTIPPGNTRPEQSNRMCSSNMNAKNTSKTNNMLSC